MMETNDQKQVLNKNLNSNDIMNEIVRIDSNTVTVSKKEKIHKCAECEKCFTWNYDLKRHVDGVHRKISNFNCELCHIHFKSKAYLSKHVESIHGNQITKLNVNSVINISL